MNSLHKVGRRLLVIRYSGTSTDRRYQTKVMKGSVEWTGVSTHFNMQCSLSCLSVMSHLNVKNQVKLTHQGGEINQQLKNLQ